MLSLDNATNFIYFLDAKLNSIQRAWKASLDVFSKLVYIRVACLSRSWVVYAP